MVPYSWLIEIEIVNKRISEKKKKYCKSKVILHLKKS